MLAFISLKDAKDIGQDGGSGFSLGGGWGVGGQVLETLRRLPPGLVPS